MSHLAPPCGKGSTYKSSLKFCGKICFPPPSNLINPSICHLLFISLFTHKVIHISNGLMIFILCWCYNPVLVCCSNCSSFATGSSFRVLHPSDIYHHLFFLELQDVLGSSITHFSTKIWELGMVITLRMSLLLGILGQS